MRYRAFSKIWIVAVILVIFAGGILAWQYFKVPKEEVRTPGEGKEVVKDETADWKIAKIEGKTSYAGKDYGYEIKYPQDWDYIKLETPPYPTMFAPKDIITTAKQSLTNIKSDKTLTLWIDVYDKILFEGGILPYRVNSNEYIQVTSSNIDVGGIKGNYYISEYIKDKGSYKIGDKTVTVDIPVNDIYFSINLFDYQYLNILEKMLSTFRFLEQ